MKFRFIFPIAIVVFALAAFALWFPLRCISCVVAMNQAQNLKVTDSVQVFVMEGVTADVLPLVQSSIQRARLDPSHKADVIIGAGPDFAKRFTDYGVTHFSPLGSPVVVVGSKGTNLDVISHELVHARLFHVFGFLNRETKMPTWLDEGYAMQFDQRPGYGIEEFCTGEPWPELTAMDSAGEFFTGELETTKRHYAFAKLLIRAWLESGALNEDSIYDLDHVNALAEGPLPPLCG